MRTEYGIKITNGSNIIEWVVVNSRYKFTKSKAQFIMDSLVKRKLYAQSSLEVEQLLQ